MLATAPLFRAYRGWEPVKCLYVFIFTSKEAMVQELHTPKEMVGDEKLLAVEGSGFMVRPVTALPW
jgi:hypothetical protein